MKGQRYVFPIPKLQDRATKVQANPVSGTKYTLLDTVKNVRVIGIYVECTWTVQPTPLEIHLTYDGKTVTFTQTDPVSAQEYTTRYWIPSATFITQTLSTTTGIFLPFLFEARSLKVEIEITGGTVSELKGAIIYKLWSP